MTVKGQEELALDVEDLKVHFSHTGPGKRDAPPVRAVDGVSLSLGRGETLALVGESGSGKSTVARAIMGLVPRTSGSITFQGERLGDGHRSPLQRHGLQMVFQNARGSLNPRMRVADCITEPMRINHISSAQRATRLDELLDMVGLSRRQAERFPQELSGGQQQRVGIARSLALAPSVLILDEPVSALDVSVQAQILNLLADLQDELGLSYLFISHDLAVVAALSDRVSVMFLGRVVETGTTEQIIRHAVHPYTQALNSAVPIEDPALRGRGTRIVLTGDLPSPSNPPSGCTFHTRCWRAESECPLRVPALVPWGDSDHLHACLFPSESIPVGAGSKVGLELGATVTTGPKS
ncbi:MAG: oligopeptide transport system ATP-binding protein [Actinomycetota bacterium]|nr:oligopeptide transport system ATP-binding protein [Actinomycetota bacterium]